MNVERVPADVRNLQPLRGVAVQPRDAAGQHAEAGHLRRLVAALEQPLHADADAEQRRARATAARIASRHGPSSAARRGEVADAGHDEAGGAGALRRATPAS